MTVVPTLAAFSGSLTNLPYAVRNSSRFSATSRIWLSEAFPTRRKFFDWTEVHLSAARAGIANTRIARIKMVRRIQPFYRSKEVWDSGGRERYRSGSETLNA